MSVQVVAKRRGFYGQLREAGEQFTVASDTEVGTWMEKVGDAGAADTTSDAEAKAALIARAKELGIEVRGNWGVNKLQEAITDAEAKAAASNA